MTVTNQQIMSSSQMVHKYTQVVTATERGVNVKTARNIQSLIKMSCDSSSKRQ